MNIGLLLLLIVAICSTDRTNHCLQHKQLTNFNSRQRAFNHGPCSPVILVPGFLATSLTVQIDCHTLKEKNPEIFSACGWNACDYEKMYPVPSVPKKQYRLWVGEVLDKFTILQTKQDKCLGNVFKFKPDTAYQQPEGLKITWFGNTQETKNQSNCGAGAIRNLGGKFTILKHCSLDGFAKIIQMLENAGYISGVNYQAIPYDFRFSVKYSNTSELIKQAIDNLYFNTGKKVVIVTHSFGSLHTLKALSEISLSDKDKMIKKWIPIGAPFLGSAKTLKQPLLGDSGYVKKVLNVQIGFNYFNQLSLAESSGSLVNLLPRSMLHSYFESDWFKAFSQYDLDWLPVYKGINKKQIYATLHSYRLKVGNNQYYATKQDYKQIFDLYTKNGSKYIRKFNQGFQRQQSLSELTKPDIPVDIIFAAKFETEYGYTLQNCNCTQCITSPESIQYAAGDTTVDAVSNVGVAYKWIYQKNRGNVRLIEYGGNKNQQNEYFQNLADDCGNDQDASCKHSCMHQDSHILQFLWQNIKHSDVTEHGHITKYECKLFHNS